MVEESNCECDHQAHTQADSTPDYRRVPDIRFRGFTYAWERQRLGGVSEFYSGGTPSVGIKEYYGGEIPFIRSAEINSEVTELFLTKEGLKNSSARLVDIGDILYALYGATSGEVGRARLKGAINQAILAIKPHMGYNSEYLTQWLRKSKHKIIETYLQGGQGNLSGTIVKELLVDFPSLTEQQKIGITLRSLDSLVTLHQRKLNKLHHIKKALLEKMFPTPGSTIPDIRFQGFTEAWERRRLGDVVKEVTRNEPTSYAPIMMITANNGFIEQSERYAFNNAGESLKKYILLEKGELAYNHGASKLRPYGSCFALTTRENARIPFVYHCFSSDEQNSEFLSIELNGADVENQLRRIVSSGARMDGLLNISFQEYASVSVLLPSVEEQDRIAAFFNDLDSLATLYQHQLNKLHCIKKALLEKMFV